MTPHRSGPAAPRAERPGLVAGEFASREEAHAWGRARLRDAGLDVRAAWVEADLLLRHAAGLTREETLLRPRAPVGDASGAAYAALIARRAAGCPSAYLVGRREFCGLALDVDPRVLIPRPETERLVEVVAAALAARPAPLVVDVGTGSGAIALALTHLLPGARAVATDVSRGALAVARGNAERLGLAGRVTWRCGDGLGALAGVVPAAGADALCANPPYVPSADVDALPREVRDHEPRAALDGGPDGLGVHRRIIAGAASYLKPGGLLALETCAEGHQARAVAALIATGGGFAPARIVKDYAGLDRVVVSTRLAAPAGSGDTP
ncbi:MAG TPA: peptide chain release factor N(5)-glutamine methyltransferase [bacterium]|nr:peptide chain release factor N(5)-glutamine methyltransferase [bacterium]